jgi:hypothetical protein
VSAEVLLIAFAEEHPLHKRVWEAIESEGLELFVTERTRKDFYGLFAALFGQNPQVMKRAIDTWDFLTNCIISNLIWDPEDIEKDFRAIVTEHDLVPEGRSLIIDRVYDIATMESLADFTGVLTLAPELWPPMPGYKIFVISQEGDEDSEE